VVEFVNDKRLDHVPGPGNFNPTLPSKTGKIIQDPTWSVSKSKRFYSPKLRQPGPGEYDIASKIVEGPRFTARSKNKIPNFDKPNDLPGPGQHNVPLAAFKNVKYSISGVKEKNRSITPGPG